MTVSPEILAAQQAYAALPYLVHIETSHFSGSFRFHTMGEAIDHIFQSAANVRKNIRTWRARGDNCWVGFDARRTYIEGPEGKIQARYILLQDSFDNRDY